MQMPVPPDFAQGSIADLLAYIDCDHPPPVDRWHPYAHREIAIHIAADGRWLHEGSEIRRPEMIRLFSRVLRRESDGSTVLVTPAECLTISVADAPFIAIGLRVDAPGTVDQTLFFRLNSEDIVMAGPANPLLLRGGPAGHLPYLHVRGPDDRRLLARLARPVYYELAALADDDGCVRSAGMLHVIGDLR